jgi:uncharacterized DUF497 family protein
MYGFRWNEWNIAKLDKHGIAIHQAEHVVNHAARPYPRRMEDGKWQVRGQAGDGAYIQVIFVQEFDDDCLFVIHARPLTDHEKRNLRRNRR